MIEIHLIREKERCTVSYFDLKRKKSIILVISLQENR